MCSKKVFFETVSLKSGYHLSCSSCIWLLNGFLNECFRKANLVILVAAYLKEIITSQGPKKEESPCLGMSRDIDHLGKHHVTMTKKEAFVGNCLQHQSLSFTFFLKKKSLLSATNFHSQQPNPMAHKTTAFLDKLTCTNYVDSGKCRDSFVLFWSQSYFDYVNIKIKNLKTDDNRDFFLVQSLLQWERHITINSCHWGISWSLQQKTSLKIELVTSADANNFQSRGWSTQTSSQGRWHRGPSLKEVVWLYCDTMWTWQGLHKLQSDKWQGRRRTRSFTEVSMWITNLKDFFIYLM